MITKTKLLLLGTVFTLGATAMLADSALAGTCRPKAPAAAPMYPPPVATWAGCYLGGYRGRNPHVSWHFVTDRGKLRGRLAPPKLEGSTAAILVASGKIGHLCMASRATSVG